MQVIAQVKRRWQYSSFRPRANSYTATTVSVRQVSLSLTSYPTVVACYTLNTQHSKHLYQVHDTLSLFSLVSHTSHISLLSQFSRKIWLGCSKSPISPDKLYSNEIPDKVLDSNWLGTHSEKELVLESRKGYLNLHSPSFLDASIFKYSDPLCAIAHTLRIYLFTGSSVSAILRSNHNSFLNKSELGPLLIPWVIHLHKAFLRKLHEQNL